MHSHAFTNSSLDDGLSAMLQHIDNRQLDVFTPETSLGNSKAGESIRSDTVQTQELRAECHCGDVSVSIARSRKEFLASPAGDGWVLSRDMSKWLAGFDVCEDCHLVSSGELNVLTWIQSYIPVPAGDLIIRSSKSYKSSEEVPQTFCRTCGATVLYSCTDRPEIVDVAIEGAMIEDWAWWNRISSGDDGLKYDPAFSRVLIEGLKVGSRRGMPDDTTSVVYSMTLESYML
ncbi:uncharacterized protein N7500_003307 [Penicillium coprophilum]|uniref:uncharacterized protein n=1 Tax=Penicillium coprophilum TaxID=36646 RepID=UPI00239BDB2F|nr:uncharacterized protein N7500_003307 [Penicillium coprophilum]KAJ5170524.1 hypothetical protein N7500_003307 [Penicillium coprophilum]